MKIADTHTLEIKTFNDWLIIKVNDTPKIKRIGIGSMLTDFNKNDVLISNEALIILNSHLGNNLQKTDPALEIISSSKIWWSSQSGILIQPNEIIHIHELPYHISTDNIIDEKIKNLILSS